MLFNSYEFVFLFLPLTFLLYFLLNHWNLATAAKGWLLAASLFFYGWWDWRYLPLVLLSIVVNYQIAGMMTKNNSSMSGGRFSEKGLLVAGILFNVGLLGYFKYAAFFVDSINHVAGSAFTVPHILLPLAVSFYTITQIAFLVDTHEGLATERNFTDYALFVTFFPHLIAGPIVHHKDLMPQFGVGRAGLINYRNISAGLFVFVIGLFKKVVIADTFAKWATNGFDLAATLTLLEAWATSLSYTFQLYFDFSGYSDMAIGLALLFNITLPDNFNSPYRALNIIDFWKRWHITLTIFITTYIYTPIIRNAGKITFAKMMVAILVAMFISGLWHGAAWTFVAWGSMHGLALVINHYWRKLKFKMPRVIAWLITFNFVNFSFIFFRAKDWDDAFKVLKGMIGLYGIELPLVLADYLEAFTRFGISFGSPFVHIHGDKWTLPCLLAGGALLFLKNSGQLREEFVPTWGRSLAFSMMLVIGLVFMVNVSPFIYFNF